ncbi:MAG TPA: inorganic diphosphatase [Planctomycetota bacterium]|nr:inorganic diphosphatase [Planctomycetota bacterium]
MKSTNESNQKVLGAQRMDLVTMIEPQDKDHPEIVQAVIETPQGSRNKYKYDEETGLFKLHKVLPTGSAFPYSFGFVPKTLAPDGDPVDVLVFADEPVPVGCIVPSRLIGVLEAEQGKPGHMERNDRLIAVAAESRDHEDLVSFRKIAKSLREEIEHFFVSYHDLDDEEFRILDCRGPSGGQHVLEQTRKEFGKKHRGRNGKRS